MPRITRSRFLDALGPAPKPTVVWQRQFDGFDGTLRKLAQCDWDIVQDEDLRKYLLDLSYQDLQPDLFRHLFPACLKFWYNTLMRNEGAELGDADFHHALLHGNILSKMLNDHERQRVLDIFIDGFLDRLDKERGFSYERPGRSANAWIYRFNSIGLVAPIIPKIWRRWWALETPGQAVSAVMYSTGLIYLKGENPIYLPWTRDEGGGGPYLTESDSNVYDHAWLDSNLTFLRSTLTPSYVQERMVAAARVLAEEPEFEMATRIASDAASRLDVVELRIDDLLANLSRIQNKQDLWDG